MLTAVDKFLKWGLDLERDVNVFQLGGQLEILAALQSGVVDAEPLSYPQ